MFITSVQLIQMIVGCLVNFWAWHYKSQGGECGVTYENIALSFAMYASYFALFAQFFLKAYCRGRKAQPDGAKVTKDRSNGIAENKKVR